MADLVARDLNCLHVYSKFPLQFLNISKSQFSGDPIYRVEREHHDNVGRQRIAHGGHVRFLGLVEIGVLSRIYYFGGFSGVPVVKFPCFVRIIYFICVKWKIVTSIEYGSYAVTVCGEMKYPF